MCYHGLYKLLSCRHDKRMSICHVQYAGTAAAAGMSWAANVFAPVISGGLGCLRLANAESAAQAVLQRTQRPQSANRQPDPQKPYKTWRQGAHILHVISRSLTPQVAQSLAKRGLVGPLLQV
jgi:hypothetical protein